MIVLPYIYNQYTLLGAAEDMTKGIDASMYKCKYCKSRFTVSLYVTVKYVFCLSVHLLINCININGHLSLTVCLTIIFHNRMIVIALMIIMGTVFVKRPILLLARLPVPILNQLTRSAWTLSHLEVTMIQELLNPLQILGC